MFYEYLERWGLEPDGDPIITRGSRLLPVRADGAPAMLKVAMDAQEKFGGLLLRWWDGKGAARVFAHDGDALLLERAEGPSSLVEMAKDMAPGGRDDDASRLICQVVAELHTPRPGGRPHLDTADLVPLAQWFRELEPAAARHGGILTECAAAAHELLAAQQDIVPLHGDIHHGNILDFGPRGWLAIDPKGLIGERGFDYANLFCNPEAEIAAAPGRLARQVDVVAEAAGLERRRLLKWIMAYAGLSAAWFLGDGEWEPAKTPLAVAELAAAELARTAS
ncbi:streptomycin 6-kinase [Nitrosospira sp. Nsp14]|uniref:aminoglycoside phosphotransferase family protein n=1 Tax=Nitrosospira sp. Nsp14 TaxID=1855333 RepID=UPI0008E2F5FB|nr:aminoglycoside phosphotransferase family protein [Nitrosospira sp. Nsp14]SFH28190.1 streptomycin 6-kinase [Nitrosospira sp. Nsp14]